MSDYPQQNYSGYPIDPGPGAEQDAERTAFLPPIPDLPAGPYPGPHPGSLDAEQTAFLPPIPAGGGYPPSPPQAGYPSGAAEETAFLPPVPAQEPYGAQAPMGATQSRFGHIQEKYGTDEFPLPQAPAAVEADASPWPPGWDRPAAPPQTWSPAPAARQDGLPPQQFPPAPGPAGQGYPGPYAAAQHQGDPLAPGAATHGYPAAGPQADAFAGLPPHGFPPAAGAGVPQGGPLSVGAAAPGYPVVGVQGEGFAGLPPQGFPPVAGGGADAGESGQALAGPGAHGGGYQAAPGAQSVGGSGLAPQNFPAAAAQGYPASAGGPPLPAGAAAPQGFGPEAGGSLREAFAAAAPTGPVGGVARPLDAEPGGSLREAFAAAQPTGPTEAAAAPAQPAPRQGSPIIDPGVQPGAITLALGALIGVAALGGQFALVLPVLLLQAGTAAGWFRLNGMWPARQGIALAALGGFVADAAILAASAKSSAPAVLAGTLGGFFLLVLILQIFRPSNPDERFYALTVSASATVMTVLGGAFLAVSSGQAVLAGALTAGVAAAVSATLRSPAVLGFAAGGFAAVVVGGAIGAGTGLGLGKGLLLGLAAGVCALVGRRVAAYDFPSRFVHMTAGVVLPLACAAPVIFLIAR
ncbi:hypothetical protein ABIA32_000907 [Streptacidiphilus sp. MAP12-20]|uniref:hypothetical protein n=1 Tax=Streptacidiphilus sp. MAP12-20 TaxID=3156299 RepID=UPI0035142303